MLAACLHVGCAAGSRGQLAGDGRWELEVTLQSSVHAGKGGAEGGNQPAKFENYTGSRHIIFQTFW